MGIEISTYSLKVGQWVKFSTNKDLESLTEKQKEIYQDNHFFFVLTEDDDMFDPCNCLIDETGKLFDHSPRMNTLGYVSLVWNSTATAYSNEEMEQLLGNEKISKVSEIAQSYLDKNDFFASKSQRLTVANFVKKYSIPVKLKSFREQSLCLLTLRNIATSSFFKFPKPLVIKILEESNDVKFSMVESN